MEPLSKGELMILNILINKSKEISLEKLTEATQLSLSSVSSYIELLKNRGIVDVSEYEAVFAKTSDEGKEYLDKLPEEKLIELLQLQGPSIDINAIEGIMGKKIASIALGWARRRGWIEVVQENGKNIVKLIRYEPLNDHRKILAMFTNEAEIPKELENNEVFKELVKRKLITIYKKKIKFVNLAIPIERAEEILRLGEGISRLTREVIVKDLWKIYPIKPYNIRALPPIKYAGKRHFFKEFIKMIKEVMESLGFEEVKDDYVIPEIWNFDILFQAQDHPSRDIHDILVLEGQADLTTFKEVVERIRFVHEKGGLSGSTGWGYSWSCEKASKLILRSHTTAVTAKALMGREASARLYTIARVFRRDNPDARHSPEFTNFDGVIMEQDLNFRKLLGLLTQILKYLGIEKLRFKPGYFPFTEPSVEGYGYVSGYGWIEIFGAGMFRPEVLEMLNVRHPVGAWGMGVERLAMVVFGINDIRLLFARDIEFIRKFPLIKASMRELRCP
ncbi:MAG: phenylalanine--tRNA ligase subunit alpha [Ignisphaera sp.]